MISKKFKELLTSSENNEDIEVIKSEAYEMRQTIVRNFKRNRFVTAWNTRKISKDRKNRSQHLYEKSRSQYTRGRLQSLQCVEEIGEVEKKIPKQHERRISLPSIFCAARMDSAGKKTSQSSISRASASSSLSSCPEEALSQDTKEAASCIGSNTDMNLESADDVPHEDDRTEQTTNDIVTQWLLQNCDDPQINADRLPTRKLLKYWMNLTDDTMRQFLKRVQRRSPSAYVLRLLKHRLDDDDDVNPNQAITKGKGNENKNNLSTDERHEAYDRQWNTMSLGPWNRRVIVIAERPVVSLHPKRKFSTRTELTDKDKIILKRRTALNIGICRKGIPIGNIEFTLQLLTISEQLKVNLRTIKFVDDYNVDEETIYVEIAIMKDTDNICKSVTTKSRLVLNDTRRVEIEETLTMKDISVCDFHTRALTFNLFSMKRNIKKTHRRVAEARFHLRNLEAVSADIHSIALIRC